MYYKMCTLRFAVVLVVLVNFGGTEGSNRCYSNPKIVGIGNNILIDEKHILPKCVSPVENLIDGRNRFGVSDGGYEATIPSWFNATLATLGQRFASKYWLSTNFGVMMAGLIAVAPSDISHPIFYTGGVHSMKNIVRGASAFILQHSVWYSEDLFGSKSNLIASITKVRSMHLVVTDNMKWNHTVFPSNPYKIDYDLWTAFEKDLKMSDIKHRQIAMEDSPYAVNQFGMASTLLGISAWPIIRPEAFGIQRNKVTDEELEGFLHFWAFIGSSLGMEDEFNVCLQPNIREARIYFEKMLTELIVPYLFHMSYESRVLIETAVKGFTETLGPIAQFDFVLRFVLEDIVRIPCGNVTKKMTPMGKTIYGIWKRLLNPVLQRSRSLRKAADLIYDGYIQNLSLEVYGFDGTNKSIVADKAFNW